MGQFPNYAVPVFLRSRSITPENLLVSLVYLVYLAYFVCLVCLVRKTREPKQTR